MKRLLIAGAALAALCGSARSQSLVSNPLILPSATFTTGDCIQATGTNSIASTGAPCGTGGGGGTVSGPTSSTIGAIAVWTDGAGTKLGDSGVLPANLPTLGASQMWGGINTYAVTPVFPTEPLTDNSTHGATTAFVRGFTAATYLPLTGGTVTGTVNVNALNVVAPAGVFKPISFNITNGFQRWQLGANSDPESGNNVGSNFQLFSYADNGTTLRLNLSIDRSTGATTWAARPNFAGNIAWDAGNLPNPLTATVAASTYLPLTGGTISGNLHVSGAATGVTPPITDDTTTFATTAHVKGVLATYLTIAQAAATYLTQATAAATYLTQTAAQQTYATILGVESAFLRITDAAAIYLTQANAAATYFPSAGGTITGATQFNAIPTITATVPAASDNTTKVATTAWTQSAITAGVGGPFMPLSGVGMPYDIAVPWIGPSIPQGPMPSSFYVLDYTFVRKVVLPISFTGAQFTCIDNATNTTVLEISRTGSVGAIIGTLTFTPGSSKGIPSISSGTATTFLPGDHLIIFTNESVANPAIADPTLNGISGTIPGALSN